MSAGTTLGKLMKRVRAQGVWHTFGYLLFTVALERLGVSLQYVFEASPLQATTASGSCTAMAVTSLSELSSADIESLRRYGGEAMLLDFERRLSRGEVCIVTHAGAQRFAGAAWLKPAEQRYDLAGDKDAMRFESCFTVPEHRGQGAFSTALSFGTSWLRSRSTLPRPIFIECSVFNTSSERAILKAGFLRKGVLLAFGKRNRLLRRAK